MPENASPQEMMALILCEIRDVRNRFGYTSRFYLDELRTFLRRMVIRHNKDALKKCYLGARILQKYVSCADAEFMADALHRYIRRVQALFNKLGPY